MKEITRYANCFVCGDRNPIGLRARFYHDGQQAFTELTATDEFEGYRGIYHGGIVATLLDEVMIKAVLAEERFAVTAEMTVRFLRPVRTGDKLRFTGRIVKSKGRAFYTEGEVRGSDDQVYAAATGKYIEAKTELKSELLKSLK